MEDVNPYNSLAAFSLFISFISFVVVLIVIWSIVSIANSNVRIRKASELILKELQRANSREDKKMVARLEKERES